MIKIDSIKKSFKSVQVLKDINIEIEKGEIVALIGPSGCGKTTTLKMINRLIRPSSGNILINGKSIYDVDIIKLRRSMGYVIQQTGLFPHMTVEENIEVIPKAENYPIEQIKKRSLELMEMIGLSQDYLERYPGELSGGQQQRVGVARAFATDPDIILMDEPFSALDPISRNQLQDELLHLQSNLHKTIVFVTHDMDEAIKLSDRICIMNNGYVQQFAPPEEILKNPASEFVENFVGKNRLWQSPELVRAEDIMIENPITCPPTLSLTRGLEKMRSRSVDSLMVTNRAGELLGIIRAETIRNTSDRSQKVSELMQTDFKYCTSQDNLIEILDTMTNNGLSSMPVIEETGSQLKGLITKGCLVTALSQPMLDEDKKENSSK